MYKRRCLAFVHQGGNNFTSTALRMDSLKRHKCVLQLRGIPYLVSVVFFAKKM